MSTRDIRIPLLKSSRQVHCESCGRRNVDELLPVEKEGATTGGQSGAAWSFLVSPTTPIRKKSSRTTKNHANRCRGRELSHSTDAWMNKNCCSRGAPGTGTHSNKCPTFASTTEKICSRELHKAANSRARWEGTGVAQLRGVASPSSS